MYKVTVNVSSTSSGFRLYDTIGVVDYGLDVGENTFYRIPSSSTSGFNVTVLGLAGTTGEVSSVSVKEYTSADMDVTRATAATRVDENGLVNYAEILGDEDVVNGDFSDGLTGWVGNPETTLSVSNNELDIQSSSAGGEYGAAFSEVNFELGKQYIVQLTVVSCDVPSHIRVGGSTTATSYSQNIWASGDIGIGTHSKIYTPSQNNTYLSIGGRNDVTTLVIDNVSVKEVTRDNVPRIDYTGGGCPHILAEPQRTNLVTDSESYTGYFNNSGTLIYNNTTSPDGLENGAKNYASTTGSFKGLSKNYGSTLNNTAYTLSIFAKAGEFDYLYFYNVGAPSGNGGVWFNLSTGNVGTTNASWSSAKMESFGNGWYRCSAVITPSGTSDNLYILLADANNSVTATANGTDGYYIYGAQLEEGSYATSYIPTSVSTVTRNQDIFTRDGIGSLINDSEGVLFAEWKPKISSDYSFFSINNGTSSETVTIGKSNNTTSMVVGVRHLGAYKILYVSSSHDLTIFNKVAVKWKAGDYAIWVNGVEVLTSTSATIPTAMNKLSFDFGDGGLDFYGEIKQLQVYKTALTDEQLTSLTT